MLRSEMSWRAVPLAAVGGRQSSWLNGLSERSYLIIDLLYFRNPKQNFLKRWNPSKILQTAKIWGRLVDYDWTCWSFLGVSLRWGQHHPVAQRRSWFQLDDRMTVVNWAFQGQVTYECHWKELLYIYIFINIHISIYTHLICMFQLSQGKNSTCPDLLEVFIAFLLTG